MFFAAFIFAVLSGFCVAIGLSSAREIESALRVKVSFSTPQILLTFGLLGSFLVLGVSSYFFVFNNTLIVVGGWILVFAIMRFVIEIMRQDR